MSPTPKNGKVCYIEIPAADEHLSAGFYERVFGWQIRLSSPTEVRSSSRSAWTTRKSLLDSATRRVT